MKVRVHVSLKPGVLDPQGRAIHRSLEGLGFTGVRDVRAGRTIELDVDDTLEDAAIDAMCRQLLANMVIENYRIEKVAPQNAGPSAGSGAGQNAQESVS